MQPPVVPKEKKKGQNKQGDEQEISFFANELD